MPSSIASATSDSNLHSLVREIEVNLRWTQRNQESANDLPPDLDCSTPGSGCCPEEESTGSVVESAVAKHLSSGLAARTYTPCLRRSRASAPFSQSSGLSHAVQTSQTGEQQGRRPMDKLSRSGNLYALRHSNPGLESIPRLPLAGET